MSSRSVSPHCSANSAHTSSSHDMPPVANPTSSRSEDQKSTWSGRGPPDCRCGTRCDAARRSRLRRTHAAGRAWTSVPAAVRANAQRSFGLALTSTRLAALVEVVDHQQRVAR